MRMYNNPECKNAQELYDDVARIKYIKRLLRRYGSKGVLVERLILNHIIILYNVFGVEPATRILFFYMEKDLWPLLKTFLVYLNYMPERINGINGKNIISSDISINMDIANILRNI